MICGCWYDSGAIIFHLRRTNLQQYSDTKSLTEGNAFMNFCLLRTGFLLGAGFFLLRQSKRLKRNSFQRKHLLNISKMQLNMIFSGQPRWNPCTVSYFFIFFFFLIYHCNWPPKKLGTETKQPSTWPHVTSSCCNIFWNKTAENKVIQKECGEDWI